MERRSSCWSLTAHDVHIWNVWVDPPGQPLASLSRLLSPDECARADRFHFERDRQHFMTARAVLRILLGGDLAIEPSRVTFAYRSHGKPSLADTWRDAHREFNLAHPHDFAVYAFTRDRAIGVDVEYVRPLENMQEVAALVFSPRELATLRAVPREAQGQAFFNGWTRKEALVKANGEVFTMPLQDMDV